jgi:hypothetical protein
MHKRIIWTLFFAAFILDYFRSHYTTESPKPSPKINKGDEYTENEENNRQSEKLKAKFNEEELKVTYDNEDEDDYAEKENIKKKRRNKHSKIDLRIEFCQS